jgi:hypothetical protein
MTTINEPPVDVVRGQGVLLTREGRRGLGAVGYELAFYHEAIRTLHGDVVRGPTYGTGTIFNHSGVELSAGDALYLQVPNRGEEIELIVADAGSHRAREVITGTAFHPIPSRA